MPLALVAVAFVWACSALPADLSPPDATSVPEHIRTLLWVEFGGTASDERALGLARNLRSYSHSSLPDEPVHPAEIVTQQASKHLVLRSDPKVRQLRLHFAEFVAALWVSSQWSADAALAEIAHRSYYGHGFHGVHAASLGYFGKPIAELAILQAAALVAITRSPASLSPWCHPERLLRRTAGLLSRLPKQPILAPLEGLLPPPSGACV